MKGIKVDTEKERKQELQQKLIIYQLLQKRLEELQQQALMLERRFIELETTKHALSDLEKMKNGGELFFPLGSGVYAKGKVLDNKNLMIELGAGVVTMKNPKSAKSFLEEKNREIENASEKLGEEINAAMSKINAMATDLQNLSG